VVLAPDLSDIGSRTKAPQVLIESILKPSAVITEGFAQQQILTVNGKIYSGAVLEESGRSLKLVDVEGKVTTIKKADIDERYGTKTSPMPAGFDKMMSTQQLAHLTAWLMAQKVVGDPSGFSFRDKPDRLDIHFGKQRIATYLKEHPKLTRRALVNVTTPSGIQVTRNFPPRTPDDIDPGYTAEQGIIHPVMHPGIWIGFGDVDGNDYWRLQAKVVFDGFVDGPFGDKDGGRFLVRNLYMSQDHQTGDKPVLEEVAHYDFYRVPEGILLRIDTTFQSNDHDFYFGDQEESGLAVRVASSIRVQGGNGTITNDRGEINAAAMWGKEAKWFDYSGIIDGRQVGLMVAPDPNNPRPSWLHARDYGVVVTNPFPKQPRERREPYVKTWVRKGEPYQLSYAVLIHDLPADKPLNQNAAYEAMLKHFD
jgi:putative heme-binding domain-containing protein